jgi:muramoyltetrapeptide carboxypeptidase LdcA involved in peptidoglycan recycling
MILDQCFGTKFSIVINPDNGHTSLQLTISLNTMAGLDTERDEFVILEASIVG